MRCKWFVFLLLSFTGSSFAQDFTKLYSDTAEFQTAFTLLREANGHLWLGGTRLPTGGDNLQTWIYRLDSEGNIVHRFRFQFEGYQTWGGMAFLGENRVGSIISQRTNSGVTENWLAILDSTHVLSYQKINGADDAIVDDANPTRSGKLLVCGFKPGPEEEGNNYWLGKVNQNAGLDWVYQADQSPNDHIRQAREAHDGSIYFSGDIQQETYNPIVGRLDSSGNPLWTLPIETPWNDGAQKFDFDTLGRVWLTGESSTSAGALFDTQLNIIEPSGQLAWQQILGGTGQDAAFLIQKAQNQGFWVAGYSNASTSGSGPISPFLMKLDGEGNSEGEAFWPFTSPSPVYDFEAVGDSTFYFCGVSNNKAYLMKRISPVLTPVFVVGNHNTVHSSPARYFWYNSENQTIQISKTESSLSRLLIQNAMGQIQPIPKVGNNTFSVQYLPAGVYWIWGENETGEKKQLGKILK